MTPSLRRPDQPNRARQRGRRRSAPSRNRLGWLLGPLALSLLVLGPILLPGFARAQPQPATPAPATTPSVAPSAAPSAPPAGTAAPSAPGVAVAPEGPPALAPTEAELARGQP